MTSIEKDPLPMINSDKYRDLVSKQTSRRKRKLSLRSASKNSMRSLSSSRSISKKVKGLDYSHH